ncbi:hypothetical protein COB55_03595 [Candidatus Wolfebacteria bacterium]|nr:MAG: hypothetical protein COB55_03595 [Candidatus Wolfebacteria bacterium]
MKKLTNIKLGKLDIKYAKKVWDDTYDYNWKSSVISWMDESISRSIYHNNKVIGVYVLGDGTINEFVGYCGDESMPKPWVDNKCILSDDIKQYENKKGIHGLHIYVDKEYRGKGIGRKLMEYSESLGDYTWGQQGVELNNLHHWKKRRTHIGEFYKNDKLMGHITITKLK